jgi:protein SCO1/2
MSTSMRRSLGAVPFFCALLVAAATARADEPTPAGSVQRPSVTAPDDDVVWNQHGQRIHFYRDVLAGKTIIVNFVYTHCTAVCPLQGARFREVQRILGSRLNRDYRLVSISIDPENDTPARLKAWGTQYGAGPGWSLITGSPATLNAITRTLFGATIQKDLHSPFIVVGDGAHGWQRHYGLMTPEEIVRRADAYRSGSAVAPAQAHNAQSEI